MNWRASVFLIALMTVACDHNEATDPIVVTDDVPQLGTASAVIEGDIKDPGSIRPVRYGFVWDSVSGLNILNAKYKLDLGSTSSSKVYQVALTNLTSNTQYFVRAYAASTDYSKIYYGNEVSFKTLP